MPPTTRKRVEAAIKKRQELERQLEKAREQEREALIGPRLKQDPKFQSLSRQDEKVRHELHLLRLGLRKKEASIEVRRRKYEEQLANLAEAKQREAELVAALEKLSQNIDALKQEHADAVESATT